MDTLKKYQIIDNTSGKILKEFETKENAKEYINRNLRFEYKRFLIKQEENDNDFIDYWSWYYFFKTGERRNCKLYTIKTIKI